MRFILFYLLMPFAMAFSQNDDSMIDRTHLNFSNKVLALSDKIDHLFADDKHNTLENKSSLRISFDTYFREAAGPYIIPDINYRLRLPNTEKRLQLFIQNQDKEDETSEAKIDQERSEERETRDYTAGLRYILSKGGIHLSTDTGIIFTIPPQFFLRLNIKKKVNWKKWSFKFDEQIKWVYQGKTTSDMDLDFDRRLNEKFLLRLVNNIYWTDETYNLTFENGPSLFQRINKDKAVSYHAHVITENYPVDAVTNYLLQVTYQENLYKNWFFLQISPFINFPRLRNFHRTPGLKIGFEFILGYIE